MNVEIQRPDIPAAPPAETRLDRLAFVDALRGWAVLAVMTVHAKMWIKPELPLWFHKLADHGARGVQLFYVVSAFTLFLSLARRSSQESAPIRNFFIRRFFRIAPMFYLALALFLARKYLAVGNLHDVTAPQVAVTALFLNAWSPRWINNMVTGQWSVAVEMTFYLLVPILAFWIKDMVRALWLVLLAFAAAAALTTLLLPLNPVADVVVWQNFLFYWLPNQSPVFALGIVLYFAWLKVESRQIDLRLGWWFLAVSIVLMIVALQGGYRFLGSPFLFSIAFVFFALGLAIHPVAFFVNAVTRSLGNVSYSFYLAHALILQVTTAVLNRFYRAAHVDPPSLAQYSLLWILGGLTTFVSASITFRLVEKPGMALGKRLIQKLEAR